MIVDVLQNSRSLLLTATHVVRIVLVAVQPGPWKQANDALLQREVELRVRVEEVFKGAQAAPGQELSLQIEQFKNASPLTMPVPGKWSEVELAVGEALVVLGAGSSVTEALQAALLIMPATVTAEVRFVAAAEGEKLPLTAVVDRARPISKELDFLFADWLWARFGAQALSGAEAADAMFSLLELPELGPNARAGLAGTAAQEAGGAPLTYVFGARRLIQALFRLFAMPGIAGLNDNSVSTWLPSLLHLRAGAKVPPGVLFDRRERAELKKALTAYKGRADPKPLAAWLDS